MPSATPRPLAIRRRPQHSIQNTEPPPPRKLKHRPCTSFSDLAPLNSFLQSSLLNALGAEERPSKRSMPTPRKTIAVVNSSGRQAASFIRVAAAVGYQVRAQLRNLDGIVATEISSLPNVTVIVGDLYVKPTDRRPSEAGVNHELIRDLFAGVQLAFINTTFWGDEVAVGKALADAAVRAGVEHYVYSSMPNHKLKNDIWPSLPLWSSKATIESYIQGLPTLAPKSTYLYTGIYNNNFTSLPYPLFCTALQPDGSFLWTAPFHPDVRLPWLDAEHDVGPAVLQIFKDGPSRWSGQRIALAYEMLSPREACRMFSRGVGREVQYVREPHIAVNVSIPAGYRAQLLALEEMYALGAEDPALQPPYFGDEELERSCPEEALALWEGYRGLEEYAREVFPLEEAANGLTWMNEDEEDGHGRGGAGSGHEVDGGNGRDDSDDDSDEEGLVMGGGTGTGTSTGGETTPARREESWLA